jgi:hypothetical protein
MRKEGSKETEADPKVEEAGDSKDVWEEGFK